MIYAAILCGILVVAVGLRALPRPAAEMVVDYLYRAAMRSAARAVAADRALVTYRHEMEQMQNAHTPQYVEGI